MMLRKPLTNKIPTKGVDRRGLMLGIGALWFHPKRARAATQVPSAQSEVTRADEIRNPGVPFRMINTIVEYKAGKPQRQVKLELLAKTIANSDDFATLVRYVNPPNDVGKLFLKNGNDMWFYDQNSKASFRISPQQRLIGQASIGDVICVNYARDYHAEAIAEDTITNAERQEEKCWRITMSAKRQSATYASILYWVNSENDRPVKAHYFSDSGRKVKIIFFRHYVPMLGNVRASSAVIIDAVETHLATVLNFSDPQEKALPDYWFQRDFLPHISDT